MAVFTALGSAVTAALGGGALATTIGLGAASLARGFAVALFLNAVTPRPSIPKQEIQATISQAAGQRIRSYGQNLVGGIRAFWEISGNQLYQIVLINHGAVDGLISYWLNGRPVTTDVNGVVTDGTAEGYAKFGFITGDPSNATTLYGANYADVANAFPNVWDPFTLTEQATMMCIFANEGAEQFFRAFPDGTRTNIQAEFRGANVIDYRTGTIGYSDLSGNCIADAVIELYGLDFGDVDFSSFQAFAQLCDEDVPLKGGGTEKRYRSWGSFGFEEAPKSVLARLRATCDAEVYQTAEGRVGIMGGVYVAPDLTITGDDILEFDLAEDVPQLDVYSTIKAKFTSQEHGYQDIDAQPWVDTDALAQFGEKVKDIPLEMCPSHSHARRMMKNEYYKANRAFTLRIKTNLVGIKARFPRGEGRHTIRVVNDNYDFDEVCEVISHDLFAEFDANGAVTGWYCDINLAAYGAEFLSWDPATEEGEPPTVPVEIDPDAVPVPVIISLTEFSSSNGVGVAVEISDIGRSDLTFEAQIREVGGPFLSMSATEFRADRTGLDTTTTYEVRVRYVGGEWSALQSITTT